MKPPKKFSCKRECGSNCCGYTAIRTFLPRNLSPDKEYFALRGMEIVKNEKPDLTFMTASIQGSIDKMKLPVMLKKPLKDIIIKVFEVVLVEYWFKVPIRCKLSDAKTGRCKDYENRPDRCKAGAGGSADNPFRMQGCPY